MCYRATPCNSTGASPAELLMGRKIRTTLPTLESNLQPKWPSRKSIKARDTLEKQKQAYYYNRRHGARCLPPLRPGDNVLTKLDGQKVWSNPAIVTKESIRPRSYIIETEQGATFRPNRRHLQAVPAAPPKDTTSIPRPALDNVSDQSADTPTSSEENSSVPSRNRLSVSDGMTQTRSGRVSRPVVRMDL